MPKLRRSKKSVKYGLLERQFVGYEIFYEKDAAVLYFRKRGETKGTEFDGNANSVADAD